MAKDDKVKQGKPETFENELAIFLGVQIEQLMSDRINMQDCRMSIESFLKDNPEFNRQVLLGKLDRLKQAAEGIAQDFRTMTVGK